MGTLLGEGVLICTGRRNQPLRTFMMRTHDYANSLSRGNTGLSKGTDGASIFPSSRGGVKFFHESHKLKGTATHGKERQMIVPCEHARWVSDWRGNCREVSGTFRI
jgi:hypothetical protein